MNHSLLTLTNLDFEILHQNEQAKLQRWGSPVGMISKNRIISRGAAKNDIYLHEVDRESEKLILLKKLTLKGGRILDQLAWMVNPYSFCLIVSIQGNQQSAQDGISELEKESSFVLNFDRDLKLISHLHQRGLEDQTSILSVCKKNVILFSHYTANPKIYLLDLRSRSVKYLAPYNSVYLSTGNQGDDGTEGDFAAKLFDDFIQLTSLGKLREIHLRNLQISEIIS